MKAGLLKALEIYIEETSLSHVVGETGLVTVSATMFFDHGKAAWVKGSVGFERKIPLGVH